MPVKIRPRFFSSGESRAQIPSSRGVKVVAIEAKPGFEAQNLQVSVTPGGTAKVTIPAVRVRVSVSFRTTASFEGDIDRKDEQGAWVSAGVRAYKRDGEKSRAVRLEPGQYRLTYRVGDAEREHVFEVAPDAVGTEIVVDL